MQGLRAGCLVITSRLQKGSGDMQGHEKPCLAASELGLRGSRPGLRSDSAQARHEDHYKAWRTHTGPNRSMSGLTGPILGVEKSIHVLRGII